MNKIDLEIYRYMHSKLPASKTRGKNAYPLHPFVAMMHAFYKNIENDLVPSVVWPYN